MSVPLTETLSTLLQTQWSSAATGLVVSDVYWSHTIYEAISQLDGITQKAILSAYNPPQPSKSTPQSREFVTVEEMVVLDLLLKPANYVDVETTNQTREAIIKWMLTTIQLNQFAVTGQKLVEVEKELVKAEIPNIIRSAWLIKATRFQIQTALT